MKWKDLKQRALDLVLALATAGATAFLVALIARYDMGISNATIRAGALYAAGAVFAAVAGGALLQRRK